MHWVDQCALLETKADFLAHLMTFLEGPYGHIMRKSGRKFTLTPILFEGERCYQLGGMHSESSATM